jgi:hypothetical protein
VTRKAFCLLVLCSAFAVCENLPDAPSAIGAPAPVVVQNKQPLTLAQVPPERASSKPEFLLWAVAANAATIADIESTAWVFRNCATCTEVSPIYGRRPTRARMYAMNIPVNAFSLWLANHVRHSCEGPQCWTWRIPLVVLSVVHGGAAAHNFTVP